LQLYTYKDDVTSICSHIENIVAELAAPELVVTEVEEGSSFNGYKLPGLQFEKNKMLETLHTRIFQEITNMFALN
jgi:hypothetical protein